jgi:mono/diheme cytochrome c family protein
LAISEEMRGLRTAMREMTNPGRRRTLAIFALVALVSGACTKIDNALASVPIFAFMRSAPSFDPYEMPLPAPPGSIPFSSPNGGELLPPLEATPAALTAFGASPHAVNPLSPEDANAQALGKVMYERHCLVCHGAQGRGDGPVIGPGKFPMALPLVSGTALGLSDGYIYGIIRAGRGLMPAYGTRMTHTERWAVVMYVRQMQTQFGRAPVAAPAQQPAATPPVTTPLTTTGQ